MKTKNTIFTGMLLFAVMIFYSQQSFAHCDSYDGPVVVDAYKALETNKPELVLKWINKQQEEEIIGLFHKTYALKNGDKEIYAIVEKHFLETLVRLHRETEGAPYTGLKPAGTTKAIVVMSDNALDTQSVDDLLSRLNNHIEMVVRERFASTMELRNTKDESPKKGREYVEAYVDYTHLLEALHDVIEHGGGHNH